MLKTLLIFNSFIQKFSRFSKIELLRLLLSPLVNFILGPFYFIRLLIYSRALISSKGDEHSRFSGIPSVNCLFYWNQALNIQKFGVNGTSKTLQSGNLRLSSLFHLSHFSLHLFWKHGNIVVLISFMVFSLTPLFYFYDSDVSYAKYVPLVILFSPLIYSSIDRVNYNATGWAIFPTIIYCINDGYFLFAAILILISLQLSFTSAFIGTLIYVLNSMIEDKVYELIFIIPYVAALTSRLIKSAGGFSEITQLIGVSRQEVLYKRKIRFNTTAFYFFLLYVSTWFFSVIEGASLSKMYFCGLFIGCLYLVSEANVMRFADPHSFLLALLAVLANELNQNFSISTMLGLILFCYPIPYAGLFLGDPKIIDILPVRKPIKINEVIEANKNFLKNVPSGARVLFCYEDPQSDYYKIFDGYRQIFEVLSYAANLKNVLVMPDWYHISENNNANGLKLWGRDLESALHNARKANADFIVRYENQLEKTIGNFDDSIDLEKIARLDWKAISAGLEPSPPFGTKSTMPVPVWHLYKVIKT